MDYMTHGGYSFEPGLFMLLQACRVRCFGVDCRRTERAINEPSPTECDNLGDPAIRPGFHLFRVRFPRRRRKLAAIPGADRNGNRRPSAICPSPGAARKMKMSSGKSLCPPSPRESRPTRTSPVPSSGRIASSSRRLSGPTAATRRSFPTSTSPVIRSPTGRSYGT